jgi:nucleotide-binding universal stress UspA family protein
MKSILVPAGGSSTDTSVFETAFAAAQLFASHLQFLHVRIDAGEAALATPHVEFAAGPALAHALDELDAHAGSRAGAAEQHVQEFCARTGIEMVEAPDGRHRASVTASWRREIHDAPERLMFHSRHHDLIVMGRAKRPNGLPANILENLLLHCGRPILLASDKPANRLNGTVMVCWRQTPDAARAMVAARPFLERAQRVILTAVDEGDGTVALDANEAADRFRWSGVPTDVDVIAAGGRAVPGLLAGAAQACNADLVVMGAYGHSRLRELIFGGATRAALASADRPVLMFH